MGDREPALLVVLIETASHRWHVAGVDSAGQTLTLLQSEDGNLDEYRGLEFDAQISFLRHRLAGVLQRGCDRLYARDLKASHFLLIADGLFPDAAEGVTERLAEHFVQWMMTPPVTFLMVPVEFNVRQASDFNIIAGELPQPVSTALNDALPTMVSQLNQSERWELIPRPQRSQE